MKKYQMDSSYVTGSKITPLHLQRTKISIYTNIQKIKIWKKKKKKWILKTSEKNSNPKNIVDGNSKFVWLSLY